MLETPDTLKVLFRQLIKLEKMMVKMPEQLDHDCVFLSNDFSSKDEGVIWMRSLYSIYGTNPGKPGRCVEVDLEDGQSNKIICDNLAIGANIVVHCPAWLMNKIFQDQMRSEGEELSPSFRSFSEIDLHPTSKRFFDSLGGSPEFLLRMISPYLQLELQYDCDLPHFHLL